MSTDLPTFSFEDFVVVVRDDMPDDVADLSAWDSVEQWVALESLCYHIPLEICPLTTCAASGRRVLLFRKGWLIMKA